MKNRKFFVVLLLVCITATFGLVLSACGKVNFKINFIVDDAVYSTIDTSGNEVINMPKDPEKEGYFFDGWYWDKDVWLRPFTASSLLNEPLSSNLNVYAKWNDENSLEGTQARFDGFNKDNASTYSITVSNATGTLNFSDIVEINSKSRWSLCTDIYAQNEIPSKIATLKEGNNTYYVLVTSESQQVKLYTLNIRRHPIYLVVFDSNGGSDVASQNVEEGSCASIPNSPLKQGYDFVKWDFDFTQPINGPTTISAVYQAKTYKIIYHSNRNDDETVEQEVVYASQVTLKNSDIFSYTAYDFLRWDTQTNRQLLNGRWTIFGAIVEDGYYLSGNTLPYSVANDLHLYAIWSPITYTISYHLNDGIVNGENATTYTIESNTIKLLDAERPGYIFDGWYREPNFENRIEQIPTGSYGNLDLYAKFTNSTYTISFDNLKGLSQEPILVVYLDDFSLPTLQNVNGYDFAGWDYNGNDFTDGNYKFTESITLSAKWNAYFEVDGNKIKKITDYGKTFSEINIPETIDGVEITTIGEYAFYNCSALNSITIPNSIVKIERNAFDCCEGLTSILIPESVTTIVALNSYNSGGPFVHCSSKLIIFCAAQSKPDGWETGWNYYGVNYYDTTIYETVWDVKEVLETSEAYYYTGNDEIQHLYKLKSTNISTFEIVDGTKSIDDKVFNECDSLTEISIPDSVEYIGEYAFYKCSNLSTIEMPENLINIGNYAFYECSNVSRIAMSNKIITIGDYAFYKCSKITEISIPDSVTEIGWCAFYNCTLLRDVGIKETSILTSLAASAFYNCTSLTSILIPENVVSIKENVFTNCINLKNIIWNATEATVTDCNNLANNANVFSGAGTNTTGIDVIFGSNVKSIPTYLFYVDGYNDRIAPKIVSVLIGENVEEIGSYAFYGCNNMSTITMSNKIKNIGKYAFYNCSSLNEISIPNSIVEIGESAFCGCTKLREVGLTETSKITIFPSHIFYNCSSLTSITIPFTVKSIEEYAFFGCKHLSNIKMGTSSTLKTIKQNAFGECSSVASITIPSSVESIDWKAFDKCTGIEEIIVDNGNLKYDSRNNCNAIIETASNSLFLGCNNTIIPNTVTTILSEAFCNCDKMTHIVIPESVTTIKHNAFLGCNNLLEIRFNAINCTDLTESSCAFSNAGKMGTGITVIFGENVQKIPAYLFYNYYNYSNSNAPKIVSIHVSSTVASIGNYAFYYCSELIEVIIDENSKLTSIGSCAFMYSAITSIKVPKNVQEIGMYAFNMCEDLDSVVFEPTSQLTTIGDSAFRYCSKLKNINIPATTTDIGNEAFAYCSSLSTITFEGSLITHIGLNVFKGCENITYKTYDNAQYLGSEDCPYMILVKALSTSITRCNINSDCRVFAPYAFMNCKNLESIIIPNGLTEISIGTFYNCTSLTTISIPENIISIGDYAFDGCTGLTNLTIPSNVITICEHAFSGCSGLTNLTIQGKSTIIGDYAFEGCIKLTKLTISNGVTSIGDSAFKDCNSLKSVIIPITVTYMGYGVFANSNSIIIYCEHTSQPESWDKDWILDSHCLARWYSTEKPSTSLEYWHYDENGNIETWE